MNQDDLQQPDVGLAVLARDIHYMTQSLSELKQQLTTIMSKYVTRDEARSMGENQDKMHSDIEQRFKDQSDINFQLAKQLTDLTREFTKLNTQFKTWMIVGGFMITAAQGILFILIGKLF